MDLEKEIQSIKLRLRETEDRVMKQGVNILMLALGGMMFLLVVAGFKLVNH